MLLNYHSTGIDVSSRLEQTSEFPWCKILTFSWPFHFSASSQSKNANLRSAIIGGDLPTWLEGMAGRQKLPASTMLSEPHMGSMPGQAAQQAIDP